jgi:hypothetical protein
MTAYPRQRLSLTGVCRNSLRSGSGFAALQHKPDIETSSEAIKENFVQCTNYVDRHALDPRRRYRMILV